MLGAGSDVTPEPEFDETPRDLWEEDFYDDDWWITDDDPSPYDGTYSEK